MFQYENQQVDEYNMELKPGVVINGLHFKVENPKGVILYFHGNKGNLKKWGAIVSKYMNYNYDVFVIDYRGYGKAKVKEVKKQCMMTDKWRMSIWQKGIAKVK